MFISGELDRPSRVLGRVWCDDTGVWEKLCLEATSSSSAKKGSCESLRSLSCLQENVADDWFTLIQILRKPPVACWWKVMLRLTAESDLQKLIVSHERVRNKLRCFRKQPRRGVEVVLSSRIRTTPPVSLLLLTFVGFSIVFGYFWEMIVLKVSAESLWLAWLKKGQPHGMPSSPMSRRWRDSRMS